MKLHPRHAAFFAALTLVLGASDLRADDSYGKAADNKIFAQALVNQVKADNADVIWVGIHASAPRAFTFSIIASTLDLVGKRSDDNDVDVAIEGRTHLTPNAKLGKIGIMMPLKDSSGKLVGSLGMALKYHDGDDQLALFTKATAIRDQVAKRIADHDALFKTAR